MPIHTLSSLATRWAPNVSPLGSMSRRRQGWTVGVTPRSRAHERATRLLASGMCAAAALPGVFDALEATRAFAAFQEGPARPGQGDRTD